MANSIVIIGAGIAGLAAGCYARMNGYETLILEMHDRPGGLCTSWDRRGYTIDGCIHHLAGCSPDSFLHRVWRELGALDGRPILFRDHLVRIEDHDGAAYNVYTDIGRLERHLLELSPADRDRIVPFARAARRMLGCDLLSVISGGTAGLLSCAPRLGTLLRWMRVTMGVYGAGFRDPFLRRAFPLAQYGFAGIPVLVHLNFLAGCQRRDLGWPHGGSLEFARSIERRYRALGGEILYRSPVDRVVIDDGRVTGAQVTRTDGANEVYHADRVISAADAHSTIYAMLGEPYVTSGVRRYFEAKPVHQEMTVHVSFGVRRDMSTQSTALAFLLPEAVTLAGLPCNHLDVEVYPADTGLAAEGTSVIKVMLPSGHGYWSELARDPHSYGGTKRRLADEVLALLDPRLPGISGQVEMTDVAPPLTIERYTGNYHGYQAWALPGSFLPKGVARVMPKIEGFHMVGQWANGAVGISTAAGAARSLIRSICRQDRRRFTTSESGRT